MRNTLAESKSPLLNAFINEFGEDLVFSTENNLKISIDELCNLAMKEAMLLKEATINIEFSKLPTAVFSKKFQKKYKDCIAFDEDGHGYGFSFGQK